MRSLSLLALALAAAFLLAACGSDEEGDEASPAPSSADVIELSATEFAFEPPTVELDGPGEYTFRLVNDGSTTHALEIEGEGIEEAATETIGPGETAELTVELGGGEYELYCPVSNHREMGMEGTIAVGGSAAGGTGTGNGTTTEDDGTTTEDEDDSGGGYYGGG